MNILQSGCALSHLSGLTVNHPHLGEKPKRLRDGMMDLSADRVVQFNDRVFADGLHAAFGAVDFRRAAFGPWMMTILPLPPA